MIKSEISTHSVEKKGFPKLMITDSDSEEKKMIVLFTKSNTGTVVYSERKNSYYVQGFYSDKWIPEEFQDFDGTIQLQNQ